MNSGLYALAGDSATATAAAWANRLDEPMTNVSNVYFGLSRLPPSPAGRGRVLAVVQAGAPARPSRIGPARDRSRTAVVAGAVTAGQVGLVEERRRPGRRGGAARADGARPRPPTADASPARLGTGTIGDRRGRRGQRRWAAGCLLGWPDRDRDLDGPAEVPGQRLGDRRAQLGLDDVAGERVRHGEQRGVLDDGPQAGQPEVGALLRRHDLVVEDRRSRRSTPRRRSTGSVTAAAPPLSASPTPAGARGLEPARSP